MARVYTQKLLEHNPTGPYYLGGWSLGFLIALEVARILKSQGKKVKRIFFFLKHQQKLNTTLL